MPKLRPSATDQKNRTIIATIKYGMEQAGVESDDLAASLHFSRDTIINRIHKGEFGDVIRDGRRYRVTEKGLQQYISKYNSLAFSKKQPTQRHRAHTNPGRI